MYGAWPYDLFPYFCCAKIVGEPDNDGFFLAPSYGPGARFRPSVILSDEVGHKLSALRADLEYRMAKEQSRLRDEAHAEISKLINKESPFDLKRPGVKP